jgi:hypothetical protein
LTLRERLARVAFEKMLKRIRENPDIPGHDPDASPEFLMLAGAWENQSERLHEDWFLVIDDVLRELTGLAALGFIPIELPKSEVDA